MHGSEAAWNGVAAWLWLSTSGGVGDARGGYLFLRMGMPPSLGTLARGTLRYAVPLQPRKMIPNSQIGVVADTTLIQG